MEHSKDLDLKSPASGTTLGGRYEDIADAEAIDIVHASEAEYTDEDYRKILRKVDWILLPVMWTVSGTQFADKAIVSTQAIFGLTKDTHLVGQQFSWLSSIFYIAFLIGEAPANYFMQRVAVGPTVAACMLIWGILVLCIAFANNFAQLMVLRFLQGLAESTTYPALLLITATFYTPREHALRLVIWGSANAGMDMITSLVNYAVAARAMRTPSGIAPWRAISLFLGSMTILLSVVAFFVFGTPREVKWLSAREKRIACARVVGGQTGSDARARRVWKWSQVRIACIDPQTWFLGVLVLMNSIPGGGTNAFGNLIWVSFGFDPLQTILLGRIPQDALSICALILAGYLASRKEGLRFYLMMAAVVPSFVGLLGLALLPKQGLLWTRWGLFFITQVGTISGPILWTLVPSNIAGRTKKSATGVVMFVGYCAGQAIGAQVFQAKDAPRYIPAIVVLSTLFGLQFFVMLAWRTYYVWMNNRRDRMVQALGLSREQALHQGRLNAESDMTDYENIHFRYST